LRDQHRDGLIEHGSLGFDSANAPAEHAESVDHGGVGIGADERVGIGDILHVHEHDTREVLEVHLVNDAGVGRNDGEVLKGGLSPAQELVALLVAQEFEFGVEIESFGRAEFIDLHGVVDDEFRGLDGIDDRRIAAERLDGIAHRREIDHGGNAGEILHQHARGRELDFLGGDGFGVPVDESHDVVALDVASVFGTQQVFEQDAVRVRQMRGLVAGLVEGIEAIDFVLLVSDTEAGTAAK